MDANLPEHGECATARVNTELRLALLTVTKGYECLAKTANIESIIKLILGPKG